MPGEPTSLVPTSHPPLALPEQRRQREAAAVGVDGGGALLLMLLLLPERVVMLIRSCGLVPSPKHDV